MVEKDQQPAPEGTQMQPEPSSEGEDKHAKHGTLSGEATSVAVGGDEGDEEFHSFAEKMREDCAPSGDLQEFLVEELITLAWRKQRTDVFRRADTSRLPSTWVNELAEHYPLVVGLKQLATQEADGAKTKEVHQALRGHIFGTEAEPLPQTLSAVLDRSFWKHAERMAITSCDIAAVWYAACFMSLAALEGGHELSSPWVRSMVCQVAHYLGVDVDRTLGSTPGFKRDWDYSREEIEQ